MLPFFLNSELLTSGPDLADQLEEVAVLVLAGALRSMSAS